MFWADEHPGTWHSGGVEEINGPGAVDSSGFGVVFMVGWGWPSLCGGLMHRLRAYVEF